MSLGKRILVIADPQCKPKHNLSYMSWIGEYIVDKQPDIVVNIGDHYDFESLSSYDKGTKSFEGRRVLADINAGNDGLKRLTDPLKRLQEQQRRNKTKVYKPEMHFTLGNHEERFDRFVQNNPEFDGLLGVDMLPIKEYGFTVHPYLKPVDIEGIYFVHYLANPFTGKPYGGTALNQLKNVGNSFVAGHKQTLDVAIRPTLDGKMQIGIINGAGYPHDEGYKGFQGNNHFRGVTMLNNVKNGYGDPCFVSLDYLKDKYAKT